MKANNDPFIKRYNILEELCKQKYPAAQDEKWNAIKYFADRSGLVSDVDKRVLKTIVSIRNTIHDSRDLFSVNNACLKFMDGMINALRVGITYQIDTELENLRVSNLNKMEVMLKGVHSKIYMISIEEQREIKKKLNEYIQSEKRASSKERAKKFYLDFCAYFNNLHNLSQIKEARTEQREKALERKKKEVLSEIQHLYNQALVEIEAECSFFQKGKAKKKLELIFKGYKDRIFSCNDFDALDDLVDDAEVDFDGDYE